MESNAKSLAEKDGWILKQSFIKYALNTELCKDDPQEKVIFFQLEQDNKIYNIHAHRYMSVQYFIMFRKNKLRRKLAILAALEEPNVV